MPLATKKVPIWHLALGICLTAQPKKGIDRTKKVQLAAKKIQLGTRGFITLHKARAVYLGGRGRNKNFTQI
jgi:hypothetical protein